MNYSTYYSQAMDRWIVYNEIENRDLCVCFSEADASFVADELSNEEGTSDVADEDYICSECQAESVQQRSTPEEDHL